MHARIRQVYRDFRQGEYIEAYLALFVALVVVVLELVSVFGDSGRAVVEVLGSVVTVLLLSIVAFATIEIRRGMSPGTVAGSRISGFFPRRAQLPPLSDQIEDVRQEIYIFGLQLSQIIQTGLPYIEDRARAGIRVRLALTSPVDPEGNALSWIDDVGEIHTFANLSEILHANLRTLNSWYRALDHTLRQHIDIRAYDRIPTAALFMVDVETKRGYIHVEPILYKFNPGQRPAFWIKQTDDSVLFDLLKTRYLHLWDQSIPIQELKV